MNSFIYGGRVFLLQHGGVLAFRDVTYSEATVTWSPESTGTFVSIADVACSDSISGSTSFYIQQHRRYSNDHKKYEYTNKTSRYTRRTKAWDIPYLWTSMPPHCCRESQLRWGGSMDTNTAPVISSLWREMVHYIWAERVEPCGQTRCWRAESGHDCRPRNQTRQW